jgi:hypothetical protein
MGIRVTAFVVDVVQFAALIDRPLWQILSEASRVPFDGDAIFSASDRATNTHYLIRADHGIARHRPGAGVVEVPPDELRSDPFLQQTTREYIAQGSGYDLSFLLRTWSLFPGQTCVRTIARGDRSMWIEAILEAAAVDHLLAPNEFAELSQLVGRILRSRKSRGRHFPPVGQDGPPIVPATFPVVPADDSDNQMAVFDEYEMLRLADLLGQLLERKPSPTYVIPAYPGRAANPAVDQAQWQRNVSRTEEWLRRAPSVAVQNPHLVTFIG